MFAKFNNNYYAVATESNLLEFMLKMLENIFLVSFIKTSRIHPKCKEL